MLSEISLLPIVDEFRDNFQKTVVQPNCQLFCIMNTDQSYFIIEIVSKRTLGIRGSKSINAAVNSSIPL